MAAGWRRIVVDDAAYIWRVVLRADGRRWTSGVFPIRVLVVVRHGDRRHAVRATFHGLWTGTWRYVWQSVVVTPKTVAEIVGMGLARGGELDHAEQLLPEAISTADPNEEGLRAACAEWFVPFPGKAAIAAALAETKRDFAATAARLSPARGRALTAEQIEGWAAELGLLN